MHEGTVGPIVASTHGYVLHLVHYPRNDHASLGVEPIAPFLGSSRRATTGEKPAPLRGSTCSGAEGTKTDPSDPEKRGHHARLHEGHQHPVKRAVMVPRAGRARSNGRGRILGLGSTYGKVHAKPTEVPAGDTPYNACARYFKYLRACTYGKGLYTGLSGPQALCSCSEWNIWPEGIPATCGRFAPTTTGRQPEGVAYPALDPSAFTSPRRG
jgi:hypothetical protein